MRNVPALAAVLTILALGAQADCPPAPDRADARAELHTRLLQSRSETEANRIADQLWQIWLEAPDAQAQELLDTGMSQREGYALAESEATLDALIAYCPDYSEGYNQRAFTRFLRADHDGSLADLDKVLAADPYHFGALSGRALNLMQQGRAQLAQQALRDAVKVHPWLKERHMISGDADPI